ncbi:hypothetical protein DYB35_004659, partial [Aphanomyces astaci]
DLRHIATLDLSKNKLTSLIGCLKHNERLKFLDLRQNRLATFPELPFECTLDTLFLGFNSLTSINGASLVRAKDHLTVLDLRDNKLPLLPDDVCQLHRLKTLDVSNNDLSDLPPGCEPLKKYLRTRGKPPSGVNALDEEFDEFNKEPTATDVEVGYLLRDAAASGTLDLSDKKFSKVPLEFWPRDSMVDKLQVLDLSKNGLTLIPFDIGLCVNLHTLVLDDNLLETLPSSIASLGLLHTLRLRKNNLAEAAFDHVLSQGTPLSCRELDVRNNALRFVPSGVVHLTSLQTLLLSYNAIAQLENIDWSRLQSLYVLSISDNKIPGEFGLMKLKTLAMNGNPQRTVRLATINKGIDEVLLFLRNKLTPSEIEAFTNKPTQRPASPMEVEAKVPLVKTSTRPVVGATSFTSRPPVAPAAAPPLPSLPSQQRDSAVDDVVATTTTASSVDLRIATLSEQLEDHGLSAAKRYALKKDLAKARAEKIRESRSKTTN